MEFYPLLSNSLPSPLPHGAFLNENLYHQTDLTHDMPKPCTFLPEKLMIYVIKLMCMSLEKCRNDLLWWPPNTAM